MVIDDGAYCTVLLEQNKLLGIHSFSFIELINRGSHFALWKWRPPRRDGRRFRARLWIDLVYLVLLLLTAGPLNPLPYPSPNP
jgi:hypothetical protein